MYNPKFLKGEKVILTTGNIKILVKIKHIDYLINEYIVTFEGGLLYVKQFQLEKMPANTKTNWESIAKTIHWIPESLLL